MNQDGGSLAERWLRTVLVVFTVGLYSLLSPFGYAAFTLLALIPTRAPERRAHILQGIMRRAYCLMHHWMRWFYIVDFDPRKVAPRIPPGPCVVIANHPTLTDTTAVLAAVPRLSTAVRADIFRTPWMKPLLSNAGYFDAGGKGLTSTSTMMEAALAQLRSGFRVLVFPEGTRSPRGGLGTFSRTAFEVACRAHVPVLALLISEEPAWLAPGDRLFRPPARLPVKNLSVLGIYEPEDFSGNSRTMRTYVQEQYRKALEESQSDATHEVQD